jgi:SDR family mycofactocin-dependent oxidoreductase
MAGTDHRGRVALITGGARGQGRSHALALSAAGADVVLVDVPTGIATTPYPLATQEDLEETAKAVEASGGKALTVTADVRSSSAMHDAVAQALARFGRLDYVLPNAGIYSVSTVAEMSDECWRDMIDVNLTGVYNTIRAALPTLLAAGRGRIVATASGVGRKGTPNIAHYVAAKWGVIGLVKSVALEVAATGITVNAVLPTVVNTAMIHNRETYELFAPGLSDPTMDEVRPYFASTNPMGVPWVEPEDITHAVMFLLGDGARYVSGETLAVSAAGGAAVTA